MPLRINMKSVEARERKAVAAATTAALLAEDAERKKWLDNDKHVNRKLDRRQQNQEKVEEKQVRKQELRKLAEEEEQSLKGRSLKKNAPPPKLTQAEILQRQLLAIMKNKSEEKSQESDSSSSPGLTPNINHIIRQETIQAIQDGKILITASTLENALSALSLETDDKHPERRMKAAYRAYQEEWLPRLKIENSTLKRSQLKELLLKQWKKAPENPMNNQT